MIRLNMIAHPFAWGLAILALAAPHSRADASPPDFKEVQQLIREHLAGATDESLNRAAVEGLLVALKGRAWLVTNSPTAVAATEEPLSRQTVFDGSVAYLRVGRVGEGLAGSIRGAFSSLGASNKLVGLVLDLRFAGGEDYAAAADVVDLFLARETPLLNAGTGLIRSREKTNAIRVPVVALVNEETAFAAEAVAASLRQSGVGLLVGQRTAGRAGVTGDFKLNTGQTLRIVRAPVQLGDAKPIPSTGVVPDIELAVKLEEARRYMADPYSGPNGANGNAAAKRVRITEADLLRERRFPFEGDLRPDKPGAAEPGPAEVQDPVLLRAIDLLKALAAVRPERP